MDKTSSMIHGSNQVEALSYCTFESGIEMCVGEKRMYVIPSQKPLPKVQPTLIFLPRGIDYELVMTGFYKMPKSTQLVAEELFSRFFAVSQYDRALSVWRRPAVNMVTIQECYVLFYNE